MTGMRMLKLRAAFALCAAAFAGNAAAMDVLSNHPDYGEVELVIDGEIYEVDEDMDTINPNDSVNRITIINSGSGLIVGSDAWTTVTGELIVGELEISGDPGVPGSVLPGDPSDYAVLGVNNGKTLSVVGALTVGDSAWIAIGDYFDTTPPGGGTLHAGLLTLNGAGSEIWIDGNGALLAESISITKGTLINSGSVTADTGLIAIGTAGVPGGSPVIRLEDGGSIETDTGERVELRDEASLEAAGLGNRITSDLVNASGHVHVESSAAMTVTGTFSNSSSDTSNGRPAGLLVDGNLTVDTEFDNSGTTIVANGGRLESDNARVSGGSLTIENGGTLDGDASGTFTQSGGTTDMNGTMGGFNTVNVSGGTFTLRGTLADPALIGQTGGVATITGTLDPDAEIRSSGGRLNLAGGTHTLADLSVSGSADVSLTSAVSTGTFSMGGANATLTLAQTGSLAVTGGTGTLSLGGVWNMNGGSARFENGVAVTFSGRINANANTLLTLTGSGPILDDTVFRLNGGYSVGDVGADGFAVLRVEGAEVFSVGAGATVSLGGNASRAFLRDYYSLGNDMLILDTDALLSDPTPWEASFSDASNSAWYTYAVMADSITGQYGLYVTDFQVLGRDEQRQNLLDAWRRHPRVGDNVGRLFNDSFINAVLDGNAIHFGHPGAKVAYNALDPFGKFNAQQLSGIMSASAGYDALMLYNGAGLTMANEAVVNTGRRLIARVGDRADILRREEIVDELEIPGGFADCGDEDALGVGPPLASRIWAEGLYHSDVSGARDGFAGYEYRGAGLMIGADKREGDIWYGGTLAYVGGDYLEGSALSSASDIGTYAALLFAGLRNEFDWYANGAVGYAYSDVRLSDGRVLNGIDGRNNADFGTHSFLLGLEGGRDFRIGDVFTVTPSAGLSYAYARAGAHSQWFEGGGGMPGSQTLTAGKITGSSLAIPLTLAVNMDVFGDEESLLSLTGSAGYEYEVLDRGAEGSFGYGGLAALGNVDAASRKPGKHTWNFGVAGRYLHGELEFGFGYDYVRRDSYNSHSLTISAGMNF